MKSRVTLMAVKGVIVIIPVALFLWLLNQNYVIFKKAIYSYKPGTRGSAILVPDKINSLRGMIDPKNGHIHWRLALDKFDVSIRLRNLVDSVTIKAKLNNGSQPNILFHTSGAGIVRLTTIVRSMQLDELSWKKQSLNGITFWQRQTREAIVKNPLASIKESDSSKLNEASTTKITTHLPQYDSLSDYAAKTPDWAKVATIGIDPLAFVQIKDYQPADSPISLSRTLRGTHVWYIYAANEDIHFSFTKEQINSKKGPSPMVIRVSKADQILSDHVATVFEKEIDVNGDSLAADVKTRTSRQVEVVIPKVKPGVYRVFIETSDNVLTRNLVSYQHYMSFDDSVFFAEGPSYNPQAVFAQFDIQTNGSNVSFKSVHTQGIQTISVGKRTIKYKKAGDIIGLGDLSGQTNIKIQKGDLKVQTDGYITIQPAKLLPTRGAATLPLGTEYNFDPYDFVIARYVPGTTCGNINFQATYRTNELKINSQFLKFQFEAPGLRGNDLDLELKSLAVIVNRDKWPIEQIKNRIISLIKHK